MTNGEMPAAVIRKHAFPPEPVPVAYTSSRKGPGAGTGHCGTN